MSCIITLSVISSTRHSGGEPGLEEDLRDLLDDLGALQLSGGQVHGHVQGGGLRDGPLQGVALAARLAEHPACRSAR